MVVCGSVKAVKYIYKYSYKGGDCATAIVVSDHDEIKRHLNGHYIGPTEAVWRLFSFSTHQELPSVTTLTLHLPDAQAVYFSDRDAPDDLHEPLDRSITTLTAWFAYNSERADGRGYLYHEFPEHYVYVRKVGWKPRKQQFSICRMWSASPFMGQRYYLRLLLTIVHGARSLEDLRTVDKIQHESFKGACIAWRLLEDDGKWIAMFSDARQFRTGRAFPHVFALALQHTTITHPLAIGQEFREGLCDDLAHLVMTGRVRVPVGGEDMGAGLAHDYGLYHIQECLNEYGRSLVEFGLPYLELNWRQRENRVEENGRMGEEMGYNMGEEQVLFDSMHKKLNEEQLASFNAIVAAVESHKQDQQRQQPFCAFFLHGPAGTGKTFLYNCLCSHYQAQGKIVLCVAPSGIAAELLPGGGRAHSTFKIPLSTDSNAVCNITKNSYLGDLIRRTSLIIWDEVPMQHKACFEAVNRTLNDVCSSGNQKLFDGIPTVLGGDFAQILPVIRRVTRQSPVLASIQKSSIWHRLTILRLKTCMRMVASEVNQQYLTFLRNMVTNTTPMVSFNCHLILVGYPRLISSVIICIQCHCCTRQLQYTVPLQAEQF